MSEAAPWEAFLAEHFPGYLLPQAARRALSEEAASLFLSRLGCPPHTLFLLRATSALAGRGDEIRELALRELPLLSRSLPPRTEVSPRIVGALRGGRIDAAATLKLRLEGRSEGAVVRVGERRYDRPETVLVKAVARRLHEVLGALGASGILVGTGWAEGLDACEAALASALSTSALAGVRDEPITAFHEQAARDARHRGYALAHSLYGALRDGIDADDPETIARVVAAGALAPLLSSTRFELAVLVRLIESLWERINARDPGEWTLHRTLILPDRAEVADFERDGGGNVKVFYNQARFAPGPHDLGVRRYFGQRGRLRPDITVVAEVPGRQARAMVIEAKLSSDPEYLVQGYRQVLLYCHEYAAELTGRPKAVLVASSSLPGEVGGRDEGDAIAVGWDGWVPESVLDGLFQ